MPSGTSEGDFIHPLLHSSIHLFHFFSSLLLFRTFQVFSVPFITRDFSRAFELLPVSFSPFHEHHHMMIITTSSPPFYHHHHHFMTATPLHFHHCHLTGSSACVCCRTSYVLSTSTATSSSSCSVAPSTGMTSHSSTPSATKGSLIYFFFILFFLL